MAANACSAREFDEGLVIVYTIFWVSKWLVGMCWMKKSLRTCTRVSGCGKSRNVVGWGK
jgi:hypothetical protein